MEFLYHKSVQKHVSDYLRSPSGNLLLLGTKGTGKYALACKIAKSLLNTDNLHRHPDFIEITSAEQVIKTEALDALKNRIGYKCVLSERFVCIIDDADLLTPTAQNSLLKLLEDFGDSVVVILVAHQRLLPTIHSRCSVLGVAPLDEEDMRRYLINTGEKVDDVSLALADGCIGRYYEFRDKRDLLITVRNFCTSLARKSRTEMLISLSLMKEKDPNHFYEKYEVDEVLSFVSLVFRLLLNTVYYQNTGVKRMDCSYFDVESAAKNYSLNELLEAVDLLGKDSERMKKKGQYTKNDFFDLIRSI